MCVCCISLAFCVSSALLPFKTFYLHFHSLCFQLYLALYRSKPGKKFSSLVSYAEFFIILLSTPKKMNTLNYLNLNCLLLNVRGLNKTFKRRLIFRWLHKQKQHFIFLQECYSSNLCASRWENEWGGRVIYSHGTNHSKGVMILINPSVDRKIEKTVCDKNGRFIITKFSLDEQSIVLVNVYAPK